MVRIKKITEEGEGETLDEETANRLYWDEGLSLREMADIYDTSTYSITKAFDEFGIPRRTPNTDKFGHYTLVNGYPSFGVKEKDDRGEWKLRSVLIHRLSAVAKYGLEAVSGVDVHHIDECDWNSGRDNLVPADRQGHMNMHNDALYKDPAWLSDQLSSGRGTDDIANECDVTRRTISEWVRRLDGREFDESTW